MFTFTDPKGIEYKAEPHEPHHLFRFSAVAGGRLPNLLSGQYTGEKFVREAWGKYVAAMEAPKPDMRLKENQKKKEAPKED